MKCETAQELFSDYCESGLERAMTHSLETHLGECGHCRAEVEGLKRVWATLDAAPIIEPPANFRETVWAKIDADEKRASEPRSAGIGFSLRSLFTKRSLAWAAAAILLLALAPIAVPGKYTPAWILSFEGLLKGSSEKTWNVTALPASFSPEDRQVLLVPLTVDAPSQIRVSLKVESGPAKLLKADSHAILSSGEKHNVALHLLPESEGKQIVLQADWDQNGEVRSKTFTFTAP